MVKELKRWSSHRPAVPLAVAGLALTMFVRTATVFIAHIMDSRAEDADIAGIERWHFIGMSLQGLRVAIPALLLLFDSCTPCTIWS